MNMNTVLKIWYVVFIVLLAAQLILLCVKWNINRMTSEGQALDNLRTTISEENLQERND